jgi:Tfp pilus assembly protein PilF
MESKPATRVAPPARPPSAPTIVAHAPAPKTDEFKLALYYQRTGDFELALVHYKTVLQRDEMNADAHNNVGNLYMSKALYEDAAREFRRVVAIEPKFVMARVNLSAALYRLKRYDESAAEARAALRLDTRNADAYVNLALAQAAGGQLSDARASLVRALEIDKHHAAAHYNLAVQYEKAGELALALDHYRAFLQYAGPEQAGYAADVRVRVQALERPSGT